MKKVFETPLLLSPLLSSSSFSPLSLTKKWERWEINSRFCIHFTDYRFTLVSRFVLIHTSTTFVKLDKVDFRDPRCRCTVSRLRRLTSNHVQIIQHNIDLTWSHERFTICKYARITGVQRYLTAFSKSSLCSSLKFLVLDKVSRSSEYANLCV